MIIRHAWFGLLLGLLLAGCGGSSPPSEAPVGVSVTAGDGRAEVRFTQEPGLQYWVFYAPGDTVAFPESTSTLGYRSVRGASSPLVVTGIANGIRHAFIVGASRDGSKVGPTSAPITAVPRPAGDVWSAVSPVPAARLNAILFDGTRFVGVGAGGAILTSDNGLVWTAAASGTTSDLHAIAFVSSRYIAVGAGGTIVTSLDRATWTARASGTTQTLRAVAGLGGTAVAVGDGGSLTLSPDGTVWTPFASGTAQSLLAIGGNTQRLVAVGAGGAMVSAIAGSLGSWQPVASGTTADLRGIAVSSARFIAVGDAGTVVGSTDGLAWSSFASPATAALRGVVWGSRFVASAADGSVLLSDDGLTWRRAVTGSTDALGGLAFGLGRYLVTGSAGGLLVSF
jgi:hypothetical protein